MTLPNILLPVWGRNDCCFGNWVKLKIPLCLIRVRVGVGEMIRDAGLRPCLTWPRCSSRVFYTAGQWELVLGLLMGLEGCDFADTRCEGQTFYHLSSDNHHWGQTQCPAPRHEQLQKHRYHRKSTLYNTTSDTLTHIHTHYPNLTIKFSIQRRCCFPPRYPRCKVP